VKVNSVQVDSAFYRITDRIKRLVSGLINYEGEIRIEELADRTIHNRVAEVIAMLRHSGFKEGRHTVKFVEKKVRAYCGG